MILQNFVIFISYLIKTATVVLPIIHYFLEFCLLIDNHSTVKVTPNPIINCKIVANFLHYFAVLLYQPHRFGIAVQLIVNSKYVEYMTE